MTQGETKTELWHQCSVAEPKRWALWDEEGVLWTWGGCHWPQNLQNKHLHLDLMRILCLKVGSMVSNQGPSKGFHKVRGHSPCRTQHPKPWPKRCFLHSKPPIQLGYTIPLGSGWSMRWECRCLQVLRAQLALWLLCPSELPRGNLTVLITLHDREQQAPFGEGACESRVEARAGTPWRTPLNTLPNRNPARQQVSPTHCCQGANTVPACGTRAVRHRAGPAVDGSRSPSGNQ